jgi:hypothetical protein
LPISGDAFNRDVVGCDLPAIGADGAYLEAGSLWLCLSLDPVAPEQTNPDYTHCVFDVAEDDFEAKANQVRQHARIWKDNRSEGASLYFLDCDGHRLKLQVGSLDSRLEACRTNPASGVEVFQGPPPTLLA